MSVTASPLQNNPSDTDGHQMSDRHMTDNWHQTDQIVMAVQTAEMRQAGVAEARTLNLSCSLMNIARGQCQIEMSAVHETSHGPVGSLVIELDRPVMRATAEVPDALFDALVERLANNAPRPISMTLTIDGQLAVSIEGDLRIDAEINMPIRDLAITLPLK